MRVVLLVPRRKDDGWRDRLWLWCRRRWETLMPDVEIYEGHHTDGPFSRSAAINLAAKLAGEWDYAVIIDADIFLRISQVRRAIATAAKTGRVTWAHRRWRGLSEDWTKRVLGPKKPHDFGPELDHDDMDLWVERTTPISWSCCVVFPRKVWDDLGGFDERFVGWGFEDMAVKSAVTGLYGWERIEGDVYHLYHPRSEERITKGEPATTASPEYVTNARLGRRYMVACIRDHGIGDQPGEEHLSAELRQRHIVNLQRDDTKLKLLARRLRLPDWDDWWPRLEELRDGAKAYRLEMAQRSRSVTVVCHTGGEFGTWAQRSGYLRRSLASFAEQVSGPIVQRVVYSDWGDERRAELEQIAGEHGFYVAGTGHHGYTDSMRRMWIYLSKRAKGQFILRIEDDFLYTRPVDLRPMIDVLNENPYLAQLALLRAPAYPREFEKGGVLGWPEESFAPGGNNGTRWLEHRNFWTNNPALFRRTLTTTPWPLGKSSERLFGDALLRDPAVRFGLWGGGETWLTHIGEVRAGTAY